MRDESKQPPTSPVIKRALSHPKRLEMLGYLRQKGTGTDEAELVTALGLDAPRVKYHLSVLQSAGLIAHIDDRKQETTGRYVAAA
jgi:DNA-binding transcriptional ArsR family regulator